MEKLSCRELGPKLGIGKSLAAEILAYPNGPDPEKFRSEDSYLRKLAAHAVRHGCDNDRIMALAMSGKKKGKSASRTPSAGKAKATAKRKASVSPAGARAGAGAIDEMAGKLIADLGEVGATWQGGKVGTDDLERSAALLGALIERVGKYMMGLMEQEDDGLMVVAMGLFDKFKHPLAEFRQTVEKLQKIRQDNLELLPRADVYAAAGEMFQVVRSFADSLVGDLVNIDHLAVWIEQAGGVFPEGRQAHEHVASQVRAFVEPQFNVLAEKLGDCAVPLDDVVPEVSHECMLRMAEELEGQAAVLRRRVEGGGK